MGRPSTVQRYISTRLGGIKIQRPCGVRNGRLFVSCLCLKCGKSFTAQFHNVYRGNYKSCGCLQRALGNKNPKWEGIGEISKTYFKSLMRGAKTRNLEFDITQSDIWNLFVKQKGICLYTGKKLNFPSSRKNSDGTASLDRINPSIGYTKRNIQWIHKDINYMKQDMNHKEFIGAVNKIHEHTYQK